MPNLLFYAIYEFNSQLKPIFAFQKIWWTAVPLSSNNHLTFSNISLLSPTLFKLLSGIQFSFFFFFGTKWGTSTYMLLNTHKKITLNIPFCNLFNLISAFMVAYSNPTKERSVSVNHCICTYHMFWNDASTLSIKDMASNRRDKVLVLIEFTA